MATITKTPSNRWKALVRKRGWPATIKTFRTEQDAKDWARRVEDEMARGGYARTGTGGAGPGPSRCINYYLQLTQTFR